MSMRKSPAIPAVLGNPGLGSRELVLPLIVTLVRERPRLGQYSVKWTECEKAVWSTSLTDSSHEVHPPGPGVLAGSHHGPPVLLLQLQLHHLPLPPVQSPGAVGGHLPPGLPVLPGDEGQVGGGLPPDQGVRGPQCPGGLQDPPAGGRGHGLHLLLLHGPLQPAGGRGSHPGREHLHPQPLHFVLRIHVTLPLLHICKLLFILKYIFV